MMIELRCEFRSEAEWQVWRAEHETHFGKWRNAVVEAVKQRGLTEPITGAFRASASVKIDQSNLHESISCLELNSRKRAGLYAFDLEMRTIPIANLRTLKILGAEGLTRAALILRSRYPLFLGCEYLPTTSEKHKFFPIPHLDLCDIGYEENTFDAFHSSDVLEHVQCLDKALSEIIRILKPGGLLVSTFPFAPNRQKTDIKATINEAGEVVHLSAPEWHGNPVQPEKGSLVFTAPGWDIIEKCKNEFGCDDARFLMVTSSTHGITSTATPGVFVFCATKAGSEPAPRRSSSRPAQMAYHGPNLAKVIGLAGLPRSGTTVVSSILGVHSRIRTVYEPWNANKNRNVPRIVPLSDFFQIFPTDMKGKDSLLVKETATQPAFLDALDALLRSTFDPVETHFVLLLRNPLHVLLSEIEARREWWGEKDLTLSGPVLQNWSERSERALRRLIEMALRHKGVIVSYERIIQDNSVVEALMRELGFELESQQLEYEKHIDRSEVRGDLTVAKNPSQPTNESIIKRDQQVPELLELLGNTDGLGFISLLKERTDRLFECGLCRADAAFRKEMDWIFKT